MRIFRQLYSFTRAVLFLLAFSIIMLPSLAWARAGGGGSFGGGDGGSGSFGGGGGSFGGGGGGFGYDGYDGGGGGGGRSGGIDDVVVTIFLSAIFVIGFGWCCVSWVSYIREKYRSHLIQLEARKQRAQNQQRVVDTIKKNDPDFRDDRFLDRISQAFIKVQQAWCEQEMSPARAFISDGIHERFSLQIEMQKAEGYRNLMENVKVLDAQIVSALTEDLFEAIHVSIRAKAVDYDLDLKTRKRRRGSGSAEEFTEIWSFHRRHGAKTLQRAGSLEGNCPSCAAPLKIQDRAECSACGSVVNSGEHDWVLAEITQLSEWSLPAPARNLAGLDKLRQSDPAVSRQHIEDRASVMFYRINAAHFFQDEDYAEPILSCTIDGLPRMAALPSKQFWKDPAIGKVETLNVQSFLHNKYDEVRVLVRWSGTLCKGDPRGESKIVRSQSIYSHVYVLSRRKGVASSPERTFGSAHCSNCGGPIAVTREENCSFCSTPLTDGKHDWVLTAVERFTPQLAYPQNHKAPEIRLTMPLAESTLDPQLLLSILAHIAASDGYVNKRDHCTLKNFAAHGSVSETDLDAIIVTAQQPETDLPIPETQEQAGELLQQVIRILLLDARFTKQEKQFVIFVARKLDYPPANVKKMIASEKQAMFQEARRLSRQQKSENRNVAG